MEKINAKSLKLVYIRPTLCPCISGTKCDRHKLIFSADRGGQSYNRDQIGSTITKTGVINMEPFYHAEVWEYPPPP